MSQELDDLREQVKKLRAENKSLSALLKDTQFVEIARIIENINDVIWKIDIKTLRYTYMSPSIYKLRGLTVDEALNEPIEKALMPESLQKIRQLMYDRFKDVYSKKGVSLSNRMEIQQPHKDGRIIWVEIVLTFIPDATGNLTEIVGVSRDITDRKIASKKV